MYLRKRRACECQHCRCLARIAIALNRRLMFGQIQYPNFPEHLCLLNNRNKLLQLYSGFNVRFLRDWSNFDLPKLMPAKHISLMSASCLSITITIYLYRTYSLESTSAFACVQTSSISFVALGKVQQKKQETTARRQQALHINKKLKIALEKNDLIKISKAWDQSLTYVHKKVCLSFTQR